MLIPVRRIGNSYGVIIPKPLLEQVGLESQADMSVRDGALVLRKPPGPVRHGWAQASARIAASGDDALVMTPEFANEDDAVLSW